MLFDLKQSLPMTNLTPSQFRSLNELFDELHDLSPSDQEARLSALEKTDPEVAAELRPMLGLATHEREIASDLEGFAYQAKEVLQERVSTGADTSGTARSSLPRSVREFLGPYRLIRQLGRGGMGEVWEAEQQGPIERRVAIKFSGDHPGPKASARFLAERQTLASMDHPNIASVFDAGQTDDGLPYLVMELVDDATPLTSYARHNSLSLKDRLRLFRTVCDAIEHAHRKQIIHRDLKPSNVLVSTVDGKAVPKVIDFGIAKPIESPLEQTLTRQGDLLGTPQYMSPEQASLGATDLDTRSDVYALGLLLYELLVGESSIPAKNLHGVPFDEALRIIREDDTPKPSARLRASQERAGDQAQSGTSASWRALQGDLDRILGKALAKDRERRYGSVNEFSEDVRRYLDNEPVLATPPSFKYQAHKFFRRHRLAASFAALALASVLGALVVTTALLIRARAAEDRALAAEHQATTEAVTAGKVAEFLESLLEEGNPERKQGAVSIEDLLERGERKLRIELADEPEVRSRLLLTVGRAVHAVGDYDRALSLYDESLALREELFGRNSFQVERVLSARSDLLQFAGRYEEALDTASEQLAIANALFEQDAPERSDPLLQVGMAHWRLGRFDLALDLLQQSADLLRGHDNPFKEAVPRVMNNLAILYWQKGDYERAEATYAKALEVQKDLYGDRHAHVASTLNNIALVHVETGDFETALEYHSEALSIRREVFEAPHPDIAESLNNLAQAYEPLGRQNDAIAAVRESLSMRRQLLDEPNDLIATSAFNLGRLLIPTNEVEARALLTKSLRDFTATLGPDHVNVSYPIIQLAQLDRLQGKAQSAMANARSALEIVENALPLEHPLRRERLNYLRNTLVEMAPETSQDEVAEIEQTLRALDDAIEPVDEQRE